MLTSTKAKVVLAVLIISLLWCASPPVHSRTIADIRSVDFKNFSFDWYPRWANTPSNGRKIVLGGGSMDTGFGYGKEPRKFFLIDEPVEYGDLTRDGHEDAVVVLGVITSVPSNPRLLAATNNT
jgi:hypothetical protein